VDKNLILSFWATELERCRCTKQLFCHHYHLPWKAPKQSVARSHEIVHYLQCTFDPSCPRRFKPMDKLENHILVQHQKSVKQQLKSLWNLLLWLFCEVLTVFCEVRFNVTSQEKVKVGDFAGSSVAVLRSSFSIKERNASPVSMISVAVDLCL